MITPTRSLSPSRGPGRTLLTDRCDRNRPGPEIDGLQAAGSGVGISASSFSLARLYAGRDMMRSA